MKAFIIPLAALLCIPAWARADEIPLGYMLNEQGKVVHESEMPRTRIIRTSACGQYITQRECNRIQKKNAERRAQARRRDVIRERVYVVERERNRDDDDRSGRRCSGRIISAKGAQRPTEAWARRVAIEAWAREVRYDLGETYLTWSNARNNRTICNPSSIGGFQIRCEARGEPCQIR
jgi:sensor c-di-GMP phosphodiesterase-like protein